MITATVDRAELLDALTWVAKAVPKRPTIPALAAVMMTATDDDHLEISAFNYEESHTARIPATVTGPGTILVAGHMAVTIAGLLAVDTVTISPTTDETAVVFAAGRSKFRVPLGILEDYPRLPERPATVGRAQAAALIAASKATWHSLARDETVPVLTGVQLVGSSDHLSMATTNRFVVTRTRHAWDHKHDFDTVVSGRALAAALSGLSGVVDVAYADGSLALSTAERSTTLRCLEADFPKVAAFIPEPDQWTTRADVDGPELVGALRRARAVVEANTSVRLEISEAGESIALSNDPAADGVGGAGIDDEASAVVSGADRVVGVNPAYLSEAVAAVGAEEMTLGFPARGPVVLVPTEHADELGASQVVSVVMPRRT